MLELLLWPFVAGIILTSIHAYFGLHVLARGIIFVDLSLAQVAALGITIAILAGHTVQSDAAYWYALVFALGGAVLFALARRFEKMVPQEAVIGIVYAVCAALAVLALDRAPQGAEHIKQIFIGSILTASANEVSKLAILYSLIGAAHWLLRKPLIQASFHPEETGVNSRRKFLWDVVFYGTFALVVTSSVRIAGVLLVFSYLIVPAAITGLFATKMQSRLLIAWALGVALSAVGLAASWFWNLPTGPAIVAAFGAAFAFVAMGMILWHSSLLLVGKTVTAILGILGLLVLAFPNMDQHWLDAIEEAAPIVQEVFLTSDELETRHEALDAIQRSTEELTTLQALDQDVRWGTKEMSAEKQDRLRQYLASRSEIQAGDQLVLKELRQQARGRQRFGIGIPLLLLGLASFFLLMRTRPLKVYKVATQT